MRLRTGACFALAIALVGVPGVSQAQTSPPAAPAGPPAPAPPVPPAPAPTGGATTTSPITTPAPASAPASPAADARRAPLFPAVDAAPAIDPAADERRLVQQGDARPSESGSKPGEVFSEDWWGRARPILEIHGYFRTRGELFHNFSLNRSDADGTYGLWARPQDQTFVDSTGTERGVPFCASEPAGKCVNKTQATANMRFRINPELHISDNLRILSQIDALDNLVLGSTPDSFAVQPAGSLATANNNLSGYRPALAGYNPDAQLGLMTNTQGPPTAGVNGYRNSIDVKRVWAEYATPVGQVRFGRMPYHWGLGMLYNAGDGHDSDWQTTYDRIMFVSGLKSADLYFGGSWDFMNSGATSATPYDVYGGSPYNRANLANVNQWSAFVARKKNPDLQRLALSRGEVVINAGITAQYRSQYLDVAGSPTLQQTPLTNDEASVNRGLVKRGGQVLTPDAWVQFLWKKFRMEAEFASMLGSIESTPGLAAGAESVKVRSFGATTQTEFRAVEDKLRLQFGFGWASGDPWQKSLGGGYEGWQAPLNNGRGPLSTFRFHPDYRVDLIFFRRILQRVEGAYYFRPSVDYDFIRNASGQKFGGGAAIIWSRASEFVQAPGHKRDLGVELDLQLYYQAKDGSLNDDPEKVGGFFAMLQYGVFFPLGGLSYLPAQYPALPDRETGSAQTMRLFLGVMY